MTARLMATRLLAMFSLSAFGLIGVVQSSLAATLEFAPCALSGSNGNGTLQAECAHWQQPLDRTDPSAGSIQLKVARLKSTALEPATDAFTVINGGPGGSSLEFMVDFAQVVQAFTRERDVVVIDQRGTGQSSPLTCQAVTDRADEYTEEETLKATQDCLAALAHDPKFFTTSAGVEDLEALRQALGYEQLSLYGVSYGTRVVQQYMRHYPAQTRAAVIDGVVPPDHALGPDIAIHSQLALDAAFDRCAETPSCNSAFPNVSQDFARLSQQLKDQPVPLTIQHPVTGERTEMELTYPHLMMWLRFSLYASETTALIPLTIHQAISNNNYLPIASNALRMLHNITTALNYGMHNAVMCTEDAPFFDPATVDYDALDATYIGRQMYDQLGAMCGVWPEGFRHADIKETLASEVPTLLLSGEVDPITPPTWAERAQQQLSVAKHIIAPGQGHGVLARGCIPKLILEFVEDPQFEEMDDSCVDHLAPYPFFINAMGPPP